ncbi:hypothetical protein B0T24DRAFT_3323 [Lasiosphaeria ovina]|uniref:Uncharacterized protein n=1 Tax=Lasiosphaeria ovina TaxID=92902 RepID=A0AAE0NIR8_9PEZI|nr:hypothetical protein B0T24DRAFT_3323 [Lasiosphaeria ovina]
MKAATIASLAAFGFVTAVSADGSNCFSGGQEFPSDISPVNSGIDGFCNTDIDLSQSNTDGSFKSTCIPINNVDTVRSIQVAFSNSKDFKKTLLAADCKSGLKNIVTDCKHGGNFEDNVNGVHFK